MSEEEDAAFFAGRKIFRHCYCVDEDSIADAGKGRLLLISTGMMKIPLSSLHGSDNALFLLLRGLLSWVQIVEKESCWCKGWRETFVLELLLSSVKSCCSAREGNLTNATPAEKLILQLSMAGEEGVAFSAGVVVAGAERNLLLLLQ